MINWFYNSFIWSVCLFFVDMYKKSGIYAFFETIKSAYVWSKAKKTFDFMVAADISPRSSKYIAFSYKISKIIYKLGDILTQSVIYKIVMSVCNAIYSFFQGSLLSKIFKHYTFRAFLITIFCLYLPVDYFLRSVVQIGVIASLWDEAFMVFTLGYVIYRKGILKTALPHKTTVPGAFILAFVGVMIFLMCVVQEYPSIAVDGFRAVVQYIFWFFIVLRLIEDDNDFKVFYSVFLIMATLVAFHGIYQYIIAVEIPAGWTSATESDVRTRVFSIMGSPNIMGSFLVIFAPLMAAVAYYSKNFLIKFTAISLTGVMCLSILFTYSRGALIGLAVAVFVFALFLDRRLIALMFSGATAVLVFVPSIRDRFAYLFTQDYIEASMRAGRMIRWQTGLDLLNESNPLLGFGLGRFGGAVAMQNKVIEETETFEYFYMDNYYLKTLVETGYLGLFFYILMLVGMVFWSIRAVSRTASSKVYPLAVGMFSGLCGVLAHCYYENIFEVPYMMAYFWGLFAGILYLGYFRRSQTK